MFEVLDNAVPGFIVVNGAKCTEISIRGIPINKFNNLKFINSEKTENGRSCKKGLAYKSHITETNIKVNNGIIQT